MVGLGGLGRLFQPKWLCNSAKAPALDIPCWIHRHLSQQSYYFYDNFCTWISGTSPCFSRVTCQGYTASLVHFPGRFCHHHDDNLLFPCALVPQWLAAFFSETNGSWWSWKYIVNTRGNLWEVLLTPKAKLVLSRDWRLLPLLLLHILWNFNAHRTQMHFNKY